MQSRALRKAIRMARFARKDGIPTKLVRVEGHELGQLLAGILQDADPRDLLGQSS